MTPNMQMEQLSMAYIRAVAASAGYQISKPEPDTDSVDGVLMASFGRKPQLNFQAKATTQDFRIGSELHFPLSIKNYNDLRADTLIPRILIVLLMPREQAQWMNQTDEELCLRRCAYWVCLADRPDTTNTSSVTVEVPTSNVFDHEQLVDLMQKVNRGDALC